MHKHHELKIEPEYFAQAKMGKKNWEFRKNDRRFHCNDTVTLREYDPFTEKYSGEELRGRIVYVLEAFHPAMHPDYCIFSWEPDESTSGK